MIVFEGGRDFIEGTNRSTLVEWLLNRIDFVAWTSSDYSNALAAQPSRCRLRW